MAAAWKATKSKVRVYALQYICGVPCFNLWSGLVGSKAENAGSKACFSRHAESFIALQAVPTNPAPHVRYARLKHVRVDVILTCVRWYVAYPLSLRHLEEMMPERAISVDHSTVHRWAIKVLPVLEKTFRRHKKSVGRSWRMEETYIKVRGQWKYLYRAVDKEGNTVDFLLRAHRDKPTARRYFEKSIEQNGEPETVTIDKSGAKLAALDTLNAERETPIKIRQNKYLNNVIEQDHRAIKRRARPMLGFKSFRCGRILLSGIELMHMIAKGQMQDRGIGYTRAQQFYSLAAK